MTFREIISVAAPAGYVNITRDVENIISRSGVSEGVCSVFAAGESACIIISDGSPLLMEDLKRTFNELASDKRAYASTDGSLKLRAALVSPDKTIPITNGKLPKALMLWDFAREKKPVEIIVSVF